MTTVTPDQESTRSGGADRPAPSRPAARRNRPLPWWLIPFGLFVIVALAYLLPPYLPPRFATSRVPETTALGLGLLVTHIFTGSVALLAGAAQFWPWLRTRHPKVHRWTGRAYLFLGVLPSALVAVPVAAMTPYGFSNSAGTMLFAVIWFCTGIAALRTALRRQFVEHRKWMIRNYSLVIGTLVSRVWQAMFAVLFAPTSPNADLNVFIHDLASASAWIGFVVSLLVAELYLQRRYGVRSRTTINRTATTETSLTLAR